MPAEAGELAAAFNVMSERLGTAQLELENWNETLEARIEEKTKELEKLEKAAQKAEARDRAKRDAKGNDPKAGRGPHRGR